MVLVVVLHAARVVHTKVLRSGLSWTEGEISRVSVVLVPTKNATKNHLAIVEGVQPTNSKLGGLKLPNAIREPVKFYLADFSVKLYFFPFFYIFFSHFWSRILPFWS